MLDYGTINTVSAEKHPTVCSDGHLNLKEVKIILIKIRLYGDRENKHLN